MNIFDPILIDIKPGWRCQIIISNDKESHTIVDIHTPLFDMNDDETRSETPSTLHWMIEIGMDFKSNIKRRIKG